MDVIKVKICGYEEDSNSLIVSFGCDETEADHTDTCQRLAYQPTMFSDLSEPEDVIKRIAVSGISIVQQQKQLEEFIADQNRVNAFKAMVGQTFQFSVQELLAPAVISDDAS